VPTVRDDRPPRNQDGPGGPEPLLTLRAMVLLLVSVGTGVVVYLVTVNLVAAFGVAVPLLLALHKLVK
jgi:hypothetical protein